MLAKAKTIAIVSLMAFLAIPTTAAYADLKVTFHTFNPGQDGWTVGKYVFPTPACTIPPAITYWTDGGVNATLSLPSCNVRTHLQPINGTDLTDITNQSIIIPQIGNVHLQGVLQQAGGPTVPGYTGCTAFNPFAHGFYIRCPQSTTVNGNNQTLDNTTRLSVVVLNP